MELVWKATDGEDFKDEIQCRQHEAMLVLQKKLYDGPFFPLNGSRDSVVKMFATQFQEIDSLMTEYKQTINTIKPASAPRTRVSPENMLAAERVLLGAMNDGQPYNLSAVKGLIFAFPGVKANTLITKFKKAGFIQSNGKRGVGGAYTITELGKATING